MREGRCLPCIRNNNIYAKSTKEHPLLPSNPRAGDSGFRNYSPKDPSGVTRVPSLGVPLASPFQLEMFHFGRTEKWQLYPQLNNRRIHVKKRNETKERKKKKVMSSTAFPVSRIFRVVNWAFAQFIPICFAFILPAFAASSRALSSVIIQSAD